MKEYNYTSLVDPVYYFIEQKIGGVRHWYSHWEKLPDPSPVFGIVWQENLHFAYGYGSKKDAKRMLRRINIYDPRTKSRIVPINKSLIDKSRERFVQVLNN